MSSFSGHDKYLDGRSSREDFPNLNSPVAQSVEQRTVNPLVAGSSPARGAILNQSSSDGQEDSWRRCPNAEAKPLASASPTPWTILVPSLRQGSCCDWRQMQTLRYASSSRYLEEVSALPVMPTAWRSHNKCRLWATFYVGLIQRPEDFPYKKVVDSSSLSPDTIFSFLGM